MTVIAVQKNAIDRLGQLGLTADLLETVLLRGDAEAKLSTDFEPPNGEGMIRYIKTVRFLREALVPVGWEYDDSKNYCRTIHPSGTFAIVVSSGDECTGRDIPGRMPSTKYPKGEATRPRRGGQLATRARPR